ncbi:MAG TPA: hypothetical protein DEA40_09760 [Parvularcula sp.]|nr:hypothetical protein [Parvularcula sp.]
MDVWLLNNSQGVTEIDVDLMPFSTPERTGENRLIIQAKLNGAVFLTKGDLWEAGCGEPTSSPTGAPEVCQTGY